MVYRVLFVCHGNKGRSPALCAYFRHRINETGVEGLEADSAGVLDEAIGVLRSMGDVSASERVLGPMMAEGIEEICDHRIKPMSEVPYDPDLVLAADRRVKDSLRFGYGTFRLELAKEFAGIEGDPDIIDPHHLRGDETEKEEAYRAMLAEAKMIAEKSFERVLRELGHS